MPNNNNDMAHVEPTPGGIFLSFLFVLSSILTGFYEYFAGVQYEQIDKYVLYLAHWGSVLSVIGFFYINRKKFFSNGNKNTPKEGRRQK